MRPSVHTIPSCGICRKLLCLPTTSAHLHLPMASSANPHLLKADLYQHRKEADIIEPAARWLQTFGSTLDTKNNSG